MDNFSASNVYICSRDKDFLTQSAKEGSAAATEKVPNRANIEESF